MARETFTISDLICTECGEKMFVPRQNQREKGHIKTMYCWNCKRVTDHIEIRSNDMEELPFMNLKERDELLIQIKESVDKLTVALEIEQSRKTKFGYVKKFFVSGNTKEDVAFVASLALSLGAIILAIISLTQ